MTSQKSYKDVTCRRHRLFLHWSDQSRHAQSVTGASSIPLSPLSLFLEAIDISEGVLNRTDVAR